MAIFAVTRRRTGAYDHGRPIEEQQAWREHAEHMDAGEAEGFFLLAGPIEGANEVLLIVRADNEAEIERRLEGDPWTRLGLLETVRIARWNLRIGSLG